VDLPPQKKQEVTEELEQDEKSSLVVRFTGAAPERAHDSDVGFDLRARFDDPRGVVIRPGEILLVDTEASGIEIPANLAAMVVPRSGLAVKKGLTVLNGPGLIDPGYRGRIAVCLHHAGRVGSADFGAVHIRPGDRIAQLVFFPAIIPDFEVVDELDDSDRGANGFGSSGAE
jgi:dUTP pyrophosphatase